MHKVAVIGAAGFAGAELVRILLAHPSFELVAASSNSDAGKAMSEVYPNFTGRTSLTYCKHDEVLSRCADELDLVFLAVPHTAAMALVPAFLEQGVSALDLSADFRLKNAEEYEQWYQAKHTASHLLDAAVYGLPEVYRSELCTLAQQRGAGQSVLVASPGCYPTASTLAAFPLLKAGLLNTKAPLIINAISGVSGAGRKANDTTQFCLANESVSAYGATTHRHTPEIKQTLSHIAGSTIKVQFTPHLAPLNRGMVATLALQVDEEAAAALTPNDVQQVYEQTYEQEPFVQVLPLGSMPQSASVKQGNYAHVGVAYDVANKVVIASCAIDNLGKGAASQAVQCANILFSLNETAGLMSLGGLL